MIGLRIEDTPGLREARARYMWASSIFSFGRPDPHADISFGYVDPKTGGIDLPLFASLRNVKARVATTGYVTNFEAVQLMPGQYVTMQANFHEQPNGYRNVIRVLEFSGGGSLSATAEKLDGYRFVVPRGETVYVGTMVLSLQWTRRGDLGYAPPRIEDEFVSAAAIYPELARLGRGRTVRLMSPLRGPRDTPAKPPNVPSVG